MCVCVCVFVRMRTVLLMLYILLCCFIFLVFENLPSQYAFMPTLCMVAVFT